MADHTQFRQRLDALLRTTDVAQVRGFLIDEDQWSEEVPVDPEFAMWLMIAASPTLSELHEQAYEWLLAHGHEEEADAIQRRQKYHAGAKEDRPRPPMRRTSSSQAQRSKKQK